MASEMQVTKHTKRSKSKGQKSLRNTNKDIPNDANSKNTKGSRKPKVVGRQRECAEESTATSKKGTRKYKKKEPKAPSPAISPAPKDQLSVAKKDKKDRTIAEDDPPTNIPQTLSAVSTATSTVSTATSGPASEIAPQTPPNKDLGSVRKTKATTPNAVSDTPTQVPPSIKNQVTTPTTPANAEKWAGETVAKSWMEKADFAKAKSDFEKIQAIPINIDKDCKKWKANAKWNQSEDYPALDSNLVKFENEYVNMSQVDVSLNRSVLLGQIPVKDSEESFWKVVFDKRATSIHILVGNESTDFFPQKAEEYKNYGQMWINNRRVECVNEDIYRFLIEVLPHGCSNSIVCNVTVIKNWNIDSVHAKHSVVIKETIELTNFLMQAQAEESALILSHHGAGRAGYFLALSVAVNKLDSKAEPCIVDIVKSIRSQRPKAVETFTQYASLYISLFYFIKRKTSKTVEGDKKATSNPNDPLCKKSVELTQHFTNALIAEATQPSTMGTTSTTATTGSAVMSLAISGQGQK